MPGYAASFGEEAGDAGPRFVLLNVPTGNLTNQQPMSGVPVTASGRGGRAAGVAGRGQVLASPAFNAPEPSHSPIGCQSGSKSFARSRLMRHSDADPVVHGNPPWLKTWFR